MKKHRNKIIAALAVIVLLVYAGMSSDNTDNTALSTSAPAETEINTSPPAVFNTPVPAEDNADSTKNTINIENTENIQELFVSPSAGLPENETEVPSAPAENAEAEDGNNMDIDENTDINNKEKYIVSKKDRAVSDAGPAPDITETPSAGGSGEAVISDKELTCTLAVRCDTILNNIDRLDKAKAGLIPEDGVIFAESTVVFYEGESVFNLLLREMKKNKIHMEYESTPIYKSAYIEGINNIYESDCGELSGWMYSVNGSFPDYGCSRYELHEGDRVELVYTCDMGADVGGAYAGRNGR